MKKAILLSLMLLGITLGQEGYDYEDEFSYAAVPPARSEPRWIIDTPTAYMLPRGAFDVDIRTFPDAGVQGALNIGLARSFSVGMGYSGERLLSEQTPKWNPRIAFSIRLRLIEETLVVPQVAIGFSSLGNGLFRKADSSLGYYEDRYLVKSPGFYLVFSKRYPFQINSLNVHGGVNYSIEDEIDSDPDIFVGMAASLSNNLLFLAEYDFAINDNKPAGRFGRGRGYLNIGLAWYLASELSLEVDFKNLLQNRRDYDDQERVIDREVRLVFMQFFVD